MDPKVTEGLRTLRRLRRDFAAHGITTMLAEEEDAALLTRMQEVVTRFALGALYLQERIHAQADRALDEEAEDLVSFFEAVQVQVADRLEVLRG